MLNPSIQTVEVLLKYAVDCGLIYDIDKTQARNQLYHLLGYELGNIDDSGFDCTPPNDGIGSVKDILTALSDCYSSRGLFDEDTPTARELLETAIMGIFTPRTSFVSRIFNEKRVKSPQDATNYFYTLCSDIHYIKSKPDDKKLFWAEETEFGKIQLSINLTKPEKDPRDIAKAGQAVATSYPKCLLCLENMGFWGNYAWPARQNLISLPVILAGDTWYFQYSPYTYYDEHCIVFSRIHEPIRVEMETFNRLVDFVEQFPHYFIGSNADLPIVGGSILSHDHFQGGRYTFPIEHAAPLHFFKHELFSHITISLIKWPLSVIRLSINDAAPYNEAKAQLVKIAGYILRLWKGYTDEESGIYAQTDGTPHNAVTAIARMNKNKLLEMDLVLRNNRTSNEHPLGIFHPHSQWHHIKKENIGLIEVMGLAILPGRLKDELLSLESILAGDIADLSQSHSHHKPWLDEMLAHYGTVNDASSAKSIIKQEVGRIFVNVLKDCGVFKWDENGEERFLHFMAKIGCGKL